MKGKKWSEYDKMPLGAMKDELGKPTPICLYYDLDKKVDLALELSVANTVLLILFETVFK